MEELRHRNDIEIKLLPNRRFIYSNRRQNIVITAEHLATDITVLFPEEYMHYSKRVDFVNSHGKEWTEGLYTPEYKHKKYPHGFNKCRFHFSLPTEVTTEGELKMQFLAYKPDKSMVTVPFEIVTIDVLNGVLAFKKNARSNPDLLILSANQSTEALFNSQRAAAKSERAEKLSKKAEEQSKAAVETANQTAESLAVEITAREQADAELQAALDTEIQRAQEAESALSSALGIEMQARIDGDTVNAAAITAETERAMQAESDIIVDLNAEIARATRAEADIAAALDGDVSELQAAIEAEVEARREGDEINAYEIATESERAQNAENDISMALAYEEQARMDGDSANADAIVMEAERAMQAELDITMMLDAEVDRATQAELDIWAALSVETADRESAIRTEEEARIAGDAANADAICAESERAQGIERDLEANIAAETARASAAEEVNADAVTQETARAMTAENEIAANFASEIQRTENDFSAALFAEETARIQGDADNAETIDTEIVRALSVESALSADLTSETQRAQEAEQLNADAIAAETARAQLIENGLQEAIANEEYRALEAETQLRAEINDEILRAETAEQQNAQAIDTERTRAQTVEGELQTTISTEITRATTAENTIAAAIVTETNRATLAESGIIASISSETVRAQTQESLLSSAIQTEAMRATQVEADLRYRVDNIADISIAEAKAYTDEVVEQVRIDGTVYRDTLMESELPTAGQKNGDLYWISDFDVTMPDHSGSAIWSGSKEQWDFNVDRYKHEDGDTIVPRDSDGALKVTDTEEVGLMADTADYGNSVHAGYKQTIRGILEKTKGLFQLTAENAAALSMESSRAITAEGQLAADISAETARAQTAEQLNATAIDSEAARAQDVESNLSASIGAEEARAKVAEQSNATAIGSETARAQAVEASKVDKIAGKGLSTEDYTTAEKTKLAGIAAGANNYTHPATHPPAIIAQDANNRFMTDTERTKLAGIEANANKYIHPTAHAPSIITQDASSRFVSDTEKAAWNNKVDKVTGKGLSTEDYTTAEKTKLAGIAAGAQVNTVTSVAGKTGAVTLAKNDVGLGSVDNTSDASKPVSTAQQAALNGKVDKVTGKGLSAEDYTTAEKTKLAGIAAGAQVNTVTSVAGKTGAVTLTKANVGLGNVDNTADSTKSVASAAKLTTARTISLTGAVTGSVSFDGSGNASIATSVGTIAASSITVTANANFGNATTLQGVLNYIANVFAGTQRVTKLVANNFDT